MDLKGLKGKPTQYKVGDNQLIQLDMDGKPITISLAEKYVLIKSDFLILSFFFVIKENT